MRLLVKLQLALLTLAASAPAWAQDAGVAGHVPSPYTPAVTSGGGRILFWIGGFAVMILAGWFIFREQVGERQTIRLLVDKIGPFFREFDPVNVHRWVERAAPHVWQGWHTRDMSSLDGYTTEGFKAEMKAQFTEEWRTHRQHKGELEKILKIHPLSLHLAGPGPAPADMELVLRVEEKGDHWVEDAEGKVIEGKANVGQVMHFWTLRHNGHRWALHHIERADRERRDLGKQPPVPPIMEWRRPEVDPAAEHASRADKDDGEDGDGGLKLI